MKEKSDKLDFTTLKATQEKMPLVKYKGKPQTEIK